MREKAEGDAVAVADGVKEEAGFCLRSFCFLFFCLLFVAFAFCVERE